MSGSINFTAQTFIPNFCMLDTRLEFYEFCKDMGELYGKVKRSFFREYINGRKEKDIKKDFLVRLGITARQFNSVAHDVKGDIQSKKKLLKQEIEDKKNAIKQVEKSIKTKQAKIKKLKKRGNCQKQIKEIEFVIHQKKRKLNRLKDRLSQLKQDLKDGRIRICFGSKKLFNKQFNLKENGYESHEQWKEDWQQARSNQFFFMGSKDESGGNQTCKFGNNHLYIRVPDCLREKYGSYIVIPHVSIPYGHAELEIARENGKALSHRFILGEKGWYLHISFDHIVPEKTTPHPKNAGCIGVDVNEKEVAVADADRFGNPVNFFTVPMNVRDKNINQTHAIIGDAAKEIIEYATRSGRPVVHEHLDFIKKRAEMRENGIKYSRMLSGFAYSNFISCLRRKADKSGVATYYVNPAFTSIIGQYKFMGRFGVSPHEAAALVIARRNQGYSEKPPAGNAFSLPVRNRGKHVWNYWRFLGKRNVKTHSLYNWRSKQDDAGNTISPAQAREVCTRTGLASAG